MKRYPLHIFFWICLLCNMAYSSLKAEERRFQPKILVSKEISLSDEKIDICLSDIKPGSHVTLKSTIIDDQKEKWEAFASFRANEKGEVHLEEQAPYSGTYDVADSMGLFWSMTVSSKEKPFFKIQNDEYRVSLDLYQENKLLVHKEITRQRLAKGIKKIFINEKGIHGLLLLPPSEKPLPVIITLSGSNGGISETRSQLLASHGFAVFGLGYFGMEGLNPKLEKIPLEYFAKAIGWLKNHPAIDSKRIGLYGVSRGAELSLVLGSFLPYTFKAIVATAPTSVVHASSSDGRTPTWLYDGKSYLQPAIAPKIEKDEKIGTNPLSPYSSTPALINAIQDKKIYTRSAIPVEKIKCPILLVSGGNDHMWPSSIYADQVINRLKMKRSAISCEHLYYPKAGHSISSPFLPYWGAVYYNASSKLWISFGGNQLEDERASQDSWFKIISFFDTHLNKNESKIYMQKQPKANFQIIYLNGPSSSGKSTLAKALQETLHEPYLHLGMDKIIGWMPEKINNWKGGIAPLGFSWKAEKDSFGEPIHVLQMGPFAKKMSDTYLQVVLMLAKMGHYLIIDDVALDKESVTLWKEALKEYSVLWVGLKTSLQVLEEREKSRGNRILGSARHQFHVVHQKVSYDLELDTDKEGLEAAVDKIKQRLYSAEEKNRR